MGHFGGHIGWSNASRTGTSRDRAIASTPVGARTRCGGYDRLWSFGETMPQPPDPLDDLFRHPERWPRVGLNELEELLRRCLIGYGRAPATDPVPYVSQMYRAFCARSSEPDRLRLAQEIAQAVDQGSTGTWALMPFMWEDESRRVIATAAMHAALNVPPVNERDPTSGAMLVVKMATDARQLPESTRAYILCGVAQLGDRRLLSNLTPLWRSLPVDVAENILGATPGILHAGSLEFLIGWLADLQATGDDTGFGALAAVIARIPSEHGLCRIYDVERGFPVFENLDTSYRKLGEWSFAEYARAIRPALLAIAASEPPPRIMPEVLRRWSDAWADPVPPPASPTGEERRGARRPQEWRVSPSARISGGSDFDPDSFEDFLLPDEEPREQEWIIQMLGSPKSATRRDALKYLSHGEETANTTSELFKAVLVRLGHDPSHSVRESAGRAAVRLNAGAIESTLRDLTNIFITEHGREFREVATIALVGLGPLALAHVDRLRAASAGSAKQRLDDLRGLLGRLNPPTEP
jgi:hypothetical protein